MSIYLYLLNTFKKNVSKKIAILVIDDSVTTRDAEKSMLEAAGYEVELAIDGIDGLTKAQKKTFDLVITDIEMPGMDGFQLTAKLKSINKYKDLPVIIVTSKERDKDRKKGMEVGAEAYITKSAFDQSNLLITIEKLIN